MQNKFCVLLNRNLSCASLLVSIPSITIPARTIGRANNVIYTNNEPRSKSSAVAYYIQCTASPAYTCLRSGYSASAKLANAAECGPKGRLTSLNPFTVEIPKTQLHSLRGIIVRLQQRTAYARSD